MARMIGVDEYIRRVEARREEVYGPIDSRTYIGTDATERICMECGSPIDGGNNRAILCAPCASDRRECMDCATPLFAGQHGLRCPHHQQLQRRDRKRRYDWSDKGLSSRLAREERRARRREGEEA